MADGIVDKIVDKVDKMVDKLDPRHPSDLTRINVDEPWELEYWSKKLSFTQDKLREAVKTAGVSVEAVKKYLSK